MKLVIYSLILTFLLISAAIAEETPTDIQATTTSGDAVILHANGRWEFVDAEKAARAREIAKQFPENRGCPSNMQGGFLGYGRCIPKGDKDYNRGSLSGKGR
jgi:hypothetical protein